MQVGEIIIFTYYNFFFNITLIILLFILGLTGNGCMIKLKLKEMILSSKMYIEGNKISLIRYKLSELLIIGQ